MGHSHPNQQLNKRESDKVGNSYPNQHNEREVHKMEKQRQSICIPLDDIVGDPLAMIFEQYGDTGSTMLRLEYAKRWGSAWVIPEDESAVSRLTRMILDEQIEDPEGTLPAGVISRFLNDDENLTAVFDEIPLDWVCVADCPTKLDFVEVYLWETFGVIHKAEDVLDTGLEEGG